MTKRLYNPKEAADYIGFKPKTLQNWRNMGTGPKVTRLGTAVRYDIADLDSWIEQQKTSN